MLLLKKQPKLFDFSTFTSCVIFRLKSTRQLCWCKNWLLIRRLISLWAKLADNMIFPSRILVSYFLYATETNWLSKFHIRLQKDIVLSRVSETFRLDSFEKKEYIKSMFVLLFKRLKNSIYMAHADPWTPWKVLEFEMSFQGHLKLLESEDLSLKIDQSPWTL